MRVERRAVSGLICFKLAESVLAPDTLRVWLQSALACGGEWRNSVTSLRCDGLTNYVTSVQDRTTIIIVRSCPHPTLLGILLKTYGVV